jgi:hydroxyacylglutathione hydrolase
LVKAREGEASFVEYILKDQPEPPLYFARMKALNRDGVPPLGSLPRPRQLSIQELRRSMHDGQMAILDTRPDRAVFMRRHLPGALHAPLNASFCMTVGSLVEDSAARLLLIVSPPHLDEAIRRLVRIGFDNVEMTGSVDTLYRYFTTGGEAETISVVGFREVEELRRSGASVVDVRNPSEYDNGHLPGAILAPYSRLPEHLPRLPKAVKLLVHCGSGQRAAVASSYLARKGYDVTLIDDLFSNYSKVGTVEKGRAEAA